MNEKRVEFGNEAREKLVAGIAKLNAAVSCTLGPMGKNVIIRRSEVANAHITKDGVTVVRDIKFMDPIEDLGAHIVKEAAMKTADRAGDGTTTATILASNIVIKGIMNAKNDVNTVHMKNGIEAAAKLAVEYVKSKAKLVEANADEICSIATISANNDKEIGKLIAEGMSKVKEDGTIAVETSKTSDTTIEVVEGIKLDRGYVSPYFMTDTEKLTAVVEDAYVLCVSSTLSNMQEIVPVLEMVSKAGASIAIFADDIEGEALSAMILNKVRGALKIVAIKTPSYGDYRKEVLRDIATVCGGTIVDPDAGVDFSNMTLGRAAKIVCTKDTTTIIDGAGKSEDIQIRQSQIRSVIESCKTDHERNQHKQRLARLSGGVAVMYVGAATEIEMKEKKDRIDDALHATRAALEEGIIPGGGITYVQAANHILAVMAAMPITGVSEDFFTGMKIMAGALTMPFKTILQNAGQSVEVVAQKISDANNESYGFDAKTNTYGDMFQFGIIDPAKVARIAIETASSVACTFLTTECVIVPEKVEQIKQ